MDKKTEIKNLLKELSEEKVIEYLICLTYALEYQEQVQSADRQKGNQ